MTWHAVYDDVIEIVWLTFWVSVFFVIAKMLAEYIIDHFDRF